MFLNVKANVKFNSFKIFEEVAFAKVNTRKVLSRAQFAIINSREVSEKQIRENSFQRKFIL